MKLTPQFIFFIILAFIKITVEKVSEEEEGRGGEGLKGVDVFAN